MWKMFAPLGFGHALVPGPIALRAYVTEAAHDKLACDFSGLRCAVLQQKPAAAHKVRRCSSYDARKIREPIFPRRQCNLRLVRKRRL
jgi:hypothetical protein